MYIEVGFLCGKSDQWLGTSLDGWVQMKKTLEDNEVIDCGLEIKTPSSKKYLGTKLLVP